MNQGLDSIARRTIDQPVSNDPNLQALEGRNFYADFSPIASLDSKRDPRIEQQLKHVVKGRALSGNLTSRPNSRITSAT